ncbi:MAG: biosynthetic-type acetolactate synthase large subunit [Bacillota bacterium]
MGRTGAQVLVDTLVEEGVEVVFGFPGGSVLGIYDALPRAAIKHVLVRHEQGAVHAADGYARVTGKTGVCIATSGPGATNLVTGLATAYMDSVPLVAITGQTSRRLLGRDSFQEADITGITMPITKHNYLVKNPDDLPRVLKEAFHIASTGRPGPVLVDVPKDVAALEVRASTPREVFLPGYKPVYEGHPVQIGEIAKAIRSSRRPLMLVGGGVIRSGASVEALRLAERCEIPVSTTLMGLGAIPSDHPLYLGMPGMHGTAYANTALGECDLLIGLGVRFDDRVTGKIDCFAANARIIHVDIDPAEIGKNVRVDIPVVGDVKNVLSRLLGLVTPAQRPEWIQRIECMKRSRPLTYSRKGLLKPQYIIEELGRLTRGEAVIVTDVGQHQMWTAQYYPFRHPRSFLSSGGLGTMGYGLPAAIGAQVGLPDKQVVLVTGDGSFQMNVQELATAVSLGVPVKVVLMNNGYLGMVRQWQELFCNGRYVATKLEGNPDFVKLAEAYGATGIKVTDEAGVRPALEHALETEGLVLLDFRVAPEENVFPLVPAEQPLSNMIGGD